jgi:hypothetical protein
MSGLLDGVKKVTYDTGSGKVDAWAVHVVDEHTLVLATWVNDRWELLNDGNPVPERAEGGGVTWS